jgi:hypothetical protein
MSEVITTTVRRDAALYLSGDRGCPATKMDKNRLAYNSRIEAMRKDEYPMLKSKFRMKQSRKE